MCNVTLWRVRTMSVPAQLSQQPDIISLDEIAFMVINVAASLL